MITNKTPSGWRDLQKKVALILEQSGLEVEVEKKVESVRATIGIDVYAKERKSDRCYEILVECKYWKKKIPQDTIYTFRSKVNDVGANIGYIISINGFQSGAYNASIHTNLSIVTWQEFLKLYEKDWLRNYFSKYIEENFREIIDYTESIVPKWALSLEGDDITKMKELRQKNDWLGWFLLDLKRMPGLINPKDEIPKLPLSPEYKKLNLPDELFMIDNFADMIKCLHKYADPAIEDFRELKEKALKLR